MEPKRFLEQRREAEAADGRALHREHDVDHMLECARARDGALLRYVARDERGDARGLRMRQQQLGALADLRDAARRGGHVRRGERLHGVDDEDVGALAVEHRRNGVRVRLRGEEDAGAADAEPLAAEAHLRAGLLARCVQRAPATLSDESGHLEEERGLADAGVAGEQERGSRDGAAAEQAVELAEPRRQAGAVGAVLLDEGARAGGRVRRGDARAGRGRAPCGAAGLGELGHRAPRSARGAAPGPLGGGVSAVLAEEGGSGLVVACHGRIVRRRRASAQGASVTVQCARCTGSASDARRVSPACAGMTRFVHSGLLVAAGFAEARARKLCAKVRQSGSFRVIWGHSPLRRLVLGGGGSGRRRGRWLLSFVRSVSVRNGICECWRYCITGNVYRASLRGGWAPTRPPLRGRDRRSRGRRPPGRLGAHKGRPYAGGRRPTSAGYENPRNTEKRGVKIPWQAVRVGSRAGGLEGIGGDRGGSGERGGGFLQLGEDVRLLCRGMSCFPRA